MKQVSDSDDTSSSDETRGSGRNKCDRSGKKKNRQQNAARTKPRMVQPLKVRSYLLRNQATGEPQIVVTKTRSPGRTLDWLGFV